MLQTAETFRHEALLYAGEVDFLTGTLPFIREGLATDEPILVAGKPQESLLLDVLLPEGGDPQRAPRMPKNRPPLTEREVGRI